MRVGTPGFQKERLIEARAARRITSKSELAKMIDVNPSAVTRWENGTHAPDADALSQLAIALNVRKEFFLRPVQERQSPVFYRSLASTLKRDTAYQEGQMQWLQDISTVLGHYVDFPAVDFPDLMAGASYRQLRDEDIEGMAAELRRHWGLGDGPCPDVVGLMERIGCIVGSIEMGTSKLDGLCTWSGVVPRPHILLAEDKMSLPRRQMDAAHELGHAILHRGVSEEELVADLKEIERQAFRFASALLMPAKTYPYELPNFSLASMLSMKGRWRVSIKAQIVRLKQLEIIDPDYAVQLYKLYSAKGWSKEEPLDRDWPIPSPRLLREAVQLIVSSGVRRKEDLTAVEFVISPEDVERLTGLPRGWFGRVGDVVSLKLKSDRPMPQVREVGGKVVPFKR